MFRTLDDVVRAGLLPVYERMQDGSALGSDNVVLSFAAEPGGRARLLGCRRLRARQPGLAPGDIVYDYEAAPLLHAFIARARWPVFYDAEDEPGLDDLLGRLLVRWPAPAMRRIRPVDHHEIVVESAAKGGA